MSQPIIVLIAKDQIDF